jgi:hypothetical protein
MEMKLPILSEKPRPAVVVRCAVCSACRRSYTASLKKELRVLTEA